MKNKYLLALIGSLLINALAFGQFVDTAQLNNYIRNTFRDRRPDKITAAQLQQSFLGLSSFLYRTVIDTLDIYEATDLVYNGLLQPGKSYYITDVDPELYGGTDIILTAITNKKFSKQGTGFFYNPRYENYGSTNNGNGVWQGRETQIVTNTITGTFAVNEQILTGDNASGYWISSNLLLTNDQEGLWETGTTVTVTGQSTGATAEVYIQQVPVYDSAYSAVVWGGRVWVNQTGRRGYEISDFELDEEDWQIMPYEGENSEWYYELVENEIEFDFSAQKIVGRREEDGNNEVRFVTEWMYENGEGNPIKFFQWGNPYTYFHGFEMGSMRDNKIINSLLSNINFVGRYQHNIQMTGKSTQTYCYFGLGSFQKDITMDQGSQQTFLYFDIYTSQEKISLRNSTQYRIALTNYSLQAGFNFVESGQENVVVEGIQQRNFNFWNYYWYRDGFKADYTEGPITRFSNLDLNGPGPIATKIVNSDVLVDGTAVEPIAVSDFQYELESSGSYSFEYEIFFNNSMGNSVARFRILNSGYYSLFKVNYTLTNQSDGTVMSKSAMNDSQVTFNIGAAEDGPYHLRITGILLGSYGGPIGLEFGPEESENPGNHTIEAGSFAKYMKLQGIIL